MGFKDKAKAFSKKFKLDSHHSIERFGIMAGSLAACGAIVLAASGASAFSASKSTLSDTAVWTNTFQTSKTNLAGNVAGLYTNEANTKALVMMEFPDEARISYNAQDYQAFLLGSDESLSTDLVETEGVTGEFYVFGSTGYVGVLLSAQEPFEEQILNLTLRANNELSYDAEATGSTFENVMGDETFAMYDQWSLYVNPAADKVATIDGLDSENFDPAKAYYEIVLKDEETKARAALDKQLLSLRSDLKQIDAYSSDLASTNVDGLFLKAPKVPEIVAGDQITGKTAAEAETDESTLALETTTTVPGGFNFDWRSGNVYDGYLKDLVEPGESYVDFLTDNLNTSESTNTDSPEASGVSGLEWILSDGTDLVNDYRGSDTTMRPLNTVMNNLSQAYQNYFTGKTTYQSTLMLDLLNLDVELRDVQTNSSLNNDEDFMVANY